MLKHAHEMLPVRSDSDFQTPRAKLVFQYGEGESKMTVEEMSEMVKSTKRKDYSTHQATRTCALTCCQDISLKSRKSRCTVATLVAGHDQGQNAVFAMLDYAQFLA
jgi:hypothetical protein